jgi:hypothetical protein
MVQVMWINAKREMKMKREWFNLSAGLKILGVFVEIGRLEAEEE